LAYVPGPGRVVPIRTDATDSTDVQALFAAACAHGDLALTVFNAGTFEPASVVDASPENFERCWRIGCFGGFLVGREAAKLMLERGRGTILFTGATASLRGGAGFVNLASPKFGLRAVAQSMARELGPRGIHVAHVVIDGQIRTPRYEHLAATRGPDALLDPAAIADAYLALHRQARSAWTLELDLRPWVERF
jgi:NAD(P)-dependent dehydrogenase (short-subunit alcohol dehydrogenase family)